MTEKQSSSENLIGIVGVRREIAPILQRMAETETERSGLARFHRGWLHDKRVVAVEIGVGKVNAAAATQSLIDRYRPACLLFTGSAGGLSPKVAVGDIVIADCVTVHDVGAHRTGGFSPTGFMLLSDDGDQSLAHRICAPAEMVALEQRIAARSSGTGQQDQPLQIHVGPLSRAIRSSYPLTRRIGCHDFRGVGRRMEALHSPRWPGRMVCRGC